MVATTNEFTYTGKVYTDAPPFTQPEGGLLDAAALRTVKQGDPLLRGYIFESHAGEVVLDDYTFNPIGTADPALGAGLGVSFVSSGAPFTADAVVDLNWIDLEPETAQARVEERFAHAEFLKVESKFWTGPLAGAASLQRSGTALKPSRALGFLAEWIGTRFPGVPYFHAGRRVSNEIAASQLTVLPDDGLAVAKVKGGGVLINGAGYTDKAGPTGATAATADQAWLYVSGTPLLVRGPVVVTPTVPRYLDGNNDLAAAFRTYVPAIDGPVAAVLVDLS